ncbi:MAG: hypothetical protein HZB54_06255 [Deltaproteobacteria bacterium]|nr:hypothetical protein [Deltaproteobacteria bacterium]
MFNRSSIFSFSILAKDMKLPKAGLLSISFIVILNSLVMLLPVDNYLPSPYFPRHEVSQKYMTLKAYIEKGESPDVIFVGSSIADMGFDVLAFEHYLKKENKPLTAFNFGINGAGPEVHLEILRHLIVAKTKVKYVVYGLSLVELNSGSSVFLSDQQVLLDASYFESKRDSFPLKGRVREFLFNNFKLYRMRDVFWPNFFTTDNTWLNTKLFKYKYKGQNRLLPDHFKDWTYNYKFSGKKWVHADIVRLENLFGNYSAEGYNLKKLIDLMEFCKSNGIKLVMVNMPVIANPEYLENTVYLNMIKATDNTNPMALYEKTIRETSLRYDVPLLDIGAKSNMEIRDFHDPLHLNYSGAQKLSKEIVRHFIKQYPEIPVRAVANTSEPIKEVFFDMSNDNWLDHQYPERNEMAACFDGQDNCRHIIDSKPSYGGIISKKAFSFDKGREYEVSFKIKVISGTVNMQVIEDHDDVPNYLSFGGLKEHDWTTKVFYIDATKTSSSNRINFTNNMSDSHAEFYIADVHIRTVGYID